MCYTEKLPMLVFPNKPVSSLNKYKYQEARIYNGEKTVSSISGAGKTGQLHVKE